MKHVHKCSLINQKLIRPELLMFPHNRQFSALAYMFFSLHYPRLVRERLLVVYRFLPQRDHRSTCYFERAWYVPPIATNRKTTFVFLSCTQSQGIFLTGLKCLKCHRSLPCRLQVNTRITVFRFTPSCDNQLKNLIVYQPAHYRFTAPLFFSNPHTKPFFNLQKLAQKNDLFFLSCREILAHKEIVPHEYCDMIM